MGERTQDSLSRASPGQGRQGAGAGPEGKQQIVGVLASAAGCSRCCVLELAETDPRGQAGASCSRVGAQQPAQGLLDCGTTTLEMQKTSGGLSPGHRCVQDCPAQCTPNPSS